MNLQSMCEEAARLTDRYDEFVIESGSMYTDDALHYFNVFRDAINEAYYAAAKRLLFPTIFQTVAVPANKQISLTELTPQPYQIRALLNADKTANVAFNFIDRNTIEVFVTGNVVLFYHYMPTKLTALADEPVFTEGSCDPMLYVSLAAARMWESEKKLDLSQPWLQEYYNQLASIRSMQGSTIRRVGRGMWR